jgi:hypothetical protein
VSKSAVKEAAVAKVSKKLTRGRSQSYADFRKALANETGMTDVQTLSAVKIYTAEEGLPDTEKFYLFRKFEVTERERCCYVRRPTPEEMAAYNAPTESACAERATV